VRSHSYPHPCHGTGKLVYRNVLNFVFMGAGWNFNGCEAFKIMLIYAKIWSLGSLGLSITITQSCSIPSQLIYDLCILLWITGISWQYWWFGWTRREGASPGKDSEVHFSLLISLGHRNFCKLGYFKWGVTRDLFISL